MSARKVRNGRATSDDLESLIDVLMSLSATHGMSAIVDALAFHATAISQAADDERVQVQWADAADKLESACRSVSIAEQTRKR